MIELPTAIGTLHILPSAVLAVHSANEEDTECALLLTSGISLTVHLSTAECLALITP